MFTGIELHKLGGASSCTPDLSLNGVVVPTREALEKCVPLTWMFITVNQPDVDSRKGDRSTERLTPVEHTTGHTFQPKIHHCSIVRHVGSTEHVHHVCAVRAHGEAFGHGRIHILVHNTTQ